MPFIGKQSTSNSQITSYTTTVGSGGQTNFTVVIEGGDETHVYLNGVLLKETTDYTVSSTQVSLVSAAVENDIVEIKVFRSFALVDAVKATGGTFSGDITVPNLTLSSNVIKASDGGNTITLDTSDNVTIAGGLTITGGIANAGTITAGTIGSSVGGVTNLIHQETTSSNLTNWDTDNIFDTTYENYIVYVNFEITGDGDTAYMRLLDNSGSEITSSYYHYSLEGYRSVNGSLSYDDNDTNNWHIARVLGSDTGESYNATFTFSGVNVDSRITSFRSLAVYGPNTGPYEATHMSGGGNYGVANVSSSVTQTVRGLRIYLSTNQIASGSKISVYGVR